MRRPNGISPEAANRRLGARLGSLEREISLERACDAQASFLAIGGLCLGAARNRRWLILPGAVCGAVLLRAFFPSRSCRSAAWLRRLGFRAQWEIDRDLSELRALTGIRGPERNGERQLLAGRREGMARAPSRKAWYRKARYWSLLLVFLVLVAVRWSAAPIAEHYLRKALGNLKGYTATFKDLSIHFLGPRLVVRGFSLDKMPPSDYQAPLLRVGDIELRLVGKELLHGELVGEALLKDIECELVGTGSDDEKDTEKDGPEARPPEAPAGPPDVSDVLAELAPFRMDRIEIRNGRFTFVDGGEASRPEIVLSELEATLENIERETPLGSDRPCVLAARGKLAESGQLTLFVTADLFAKPLALAGQAGLKGLRLKEINPFIAAKTGMAVEKGELDLFASFTTARGEVSGGVKPSLKHVSMRPWGEDLVAKLKAGLVDTALWILSDRVPSRRALTGIVPFAGELTGPDAMLLPTVMSIVRNAFVVGLASGFAHLPPEESAKAPMGGGSR